MTDKEILAELKKSYEYLQDIRENGCFDHCNGQMANNLDLLDLTISNVATIYYDFYETLDKEELRVPILERKFNDKVYIARNVDGDYEVGNKLNSITCGDTDYYWYEDNDFIE